MSSITPVLILAVATFSKCVPAPSTPPGGTPTTPPEPTLPAWTTGVVDVEPAFAAIPMVIDVRHGTHAGFDRMVFEFDGPIPGYHVEYVDSPTWMCGSGDEVWLEGDAWLQIDLEPAAAHTDEGQPTLQIGSFDPMYEVLLEAQQVCDFEAIVSWVAGTSSPNGFRVFELSDPSRLVVDLKH